MQIRKGASRAIQESRLADFGRRLTSAGLAILLAVGPMGPGTLGDGIIPSAQAAEDDGTGLVGGSALPPSLTAPGDFSQSMRHGLTVNFFDCTIQGVLGSLTNAGTSGLQGGGAGVYGALTGGAGGGGANCPPLPDREPEELTCQDVQHEGEFSREKLHLEMERLRQGVEAYSCMNAKLDAAANQLQCIKGKADLLAQQIRALQTEYVTKIQHAQKWVGAYKEHIADRQAQQQFVKERAQQTRQAQQQAAQLLRRMPADREQVTQLQQQVSVARRQLEEFKESRTTALAMECFNTAKKGHYQCSPTGPAVTAKEYLLCRVEQNQHIDEGGVVRRDDATRARAAGRRQALEAVLEQILANAPSDTSANPGAGGQGGNMIQSMGSQPVNVLSLADVENQYGDQLRSFNDKGIDVHAFVTEVMGSCYKTAERRVRREDSRGSSGIGVLKEQLKRAEREASVKVNEFLSDYSQAYSQFTEALPAGNQEPMDISACRSAQPHMQTQCMSQAQQAIDQVLNHKPQTAVIEGATQGTQFSFECAGLNDCANKLDRVDRNLGTLVQRRSLELERGKQVFNSQVQAYTQQMANQMSQMNVDLKGKLDGLNAILSAAGVSGRGLINTNDSVQGEDFQFDQDGLIQAPGDVLGLIGSKMNPPMMNVNGDMFQSAMGAISQRNGELEAELAAITRVQAKAENLAQRCVGEEIEKLAQSLDRSIANWTSSRCGYSQNYCVGSQDRIHDLASTIEDIEPVGMDLESIDSLRSGVSGMCEADAGARAAARSEARRIEQLLQGKRRELATQQSEFDVCNSRSGDPDCSSAASARGRAQREVSELEAQLAAARERGGGGTGESSGGSGAQCSRIYSEIAGKAARIRSRSREASDSAAGRAM